MIHRARLSLIFLMFATSLSLAQQNQTLDISKRPDENPSWLPKAIPTIDLTTLSYARMSDDKQTIQIVKPGIRTETKTRIIPKTSYTTETRQRTIKVDGKEVTQDYTVQVPVTVNEEQTHVVRVVEKIQKFDLPLNKVMAWELSGKVLSLDELSKRLGRPTQVLVERENLPPETIEPYFEGVIKRDTIVIYCPIEGVKPINSPKP